MMRFVFHCFLFQYCVVANVDMMVVLLSFSLNAVCVDVSKYLVVDVMGNDN